MKALILAAGLGSRLFDYTSRKPKCLVRINDKAILEYQIDALIKNDITDIVIVLGYKSELVKEFLLSNKNYKHLNIIFINNKDYSESNSSYSFWLARKELVGSSYIHLNCDVIFDAKLIRKIISSKYQNLMVVDTNCNLVDGVMEQVILSGERIVKMDNRNVRNATGKGSGISKLSDDCIKWIFPKIDRYVRDGDKDQNYYTFLRDAIHYKEFYGLRSDNFFIKEVNTIEELNEAEAAIDLLDKS